MYEVQLGGVLQFVAIWRFVLHLGFKKDRYWKIWIISIPKSVRYGIKKVLLIVKKTCYYYLGSDLGVNPRYEFGYGLSYPTFSIGDMSLKSNKKGAAPLPDEKKAIEPGGYPDPPRSSRYRAVQGNQDGESRGCNSSSILRSLPARHHPR